MHDVYNQLTYKLIGSGWIPLEIREAVPSEFAVGTWHCHWALGTTAYVDSFAFISRETAAMAITPNSSKILGRLRRSPRSSDATLMPPARTPPGLPPLDLDMPSPGEVVFQPIRADAKLGVFEMAVSVFSEAASLASSIPYLGAVAGIFVQIIRIKGVRDSSFSFLLKRKG